MIRRITAWAIVLVVFSTAFILGCGSAVTTTLPPATASLAPATTTTADVRELEKTFLTVFVTDIARFRALFPAGDDSKDDLIEVRRKLGVLEDLSTSAARIEAPSERTDALRREWKATISIFVDAYQALSDGDMFTADRMLDGLEGGGERMYSLGEKTGALARELDMVDFVQSTIDTVPTTPVEPVTTNTTTAPKWVEVTKLSGKTNKTGEVFELTGAPARMSYTITDGFTAVYIMQDGQNLETDGGFPDVNSMDAVKDSTRLTKDPGSYYLVVRGNSPYTVTIEEQR